MWLCPCRGTQCCNTPSGLKDRKGGERKRERRRERSKKRVIFHPSIPMGIAVGLFTRVATFHFLLCIFVCVRECVSVRCVHVRTVRGSCSTAVIYSGGLWPYLFSISLMLGSGFPPALPWPTGRRVWVGPLQNCLESAPQTHTHTRSPLRFFRCPTSQPHFSASISF